MNKLLVICGPTATGKTGLGIKLAKELGGEIVSADSRQIYKGMNIGTGKDLPKNSKFKIPHFVPLGGTSRGKQYSNRDGLDIGYYLIKKIPVWLYDVVEPDYRFSVADYVNCAYEVIENIWERGKLPIVVGGTGFYIKGLVEGIDTMGIKPDWELRKQLSNYPIIQLSSLLKKLDPERWRKMNESDRKNPRRLIRAIEVTENSLPCVAKGFAGGTKIRKLPRRAGSAFGGKIENLLMIGLRAPYKFLYQRIDKRVDERIERGVEKEVSNLLKKGYNWKNSALGVTIGYREWQPYFECSNVQMFKCSKIKEEIIQRWKFAEHNYARRQMTWFRKALRQAQGKWSDISQGSWQTEVENLVDTWYYQR